MTWPGAGLGIASAALLVGCAGEAAPAPSTLVDGSRARPPPVALDGIAGPSVVTSVVLQRGAIDNQPGTASCIGSALTAGGVAVVRVGVSGSSVTFLDRRRIVVRGCDASGSAADSEPWCGHAFTRLRSGRLNDPRLSLTCRGRNGNPVAFAWLQPLPTAAYVAVSQSGYSEVYPVVGTTPIRVTSDDIDIAISRASFSISEHAADGRRLRFYAMDAQVAG